MMRYLKSRVFGPELSAMGGKAGDSIHESPGIGPKLASGVAATAGVVAKGDGFVSCAAEFLLVVIRHLVDR